MFEPGLSIAEVYAAAERVRPYVLRTPVLTRVVQTPAGEATLSFKCESLQSIGAFKLRGAFSCMTALPPRTPGVVTWSSGNHAQAVARAAKVLGLRATVVMPDNAPAVKRARVVEDGAHVITVGPDSEERRAVGEALAASEGWAAIPPYDHPHVAAGQGTAALELLDEVGAIDHFYCPVSGGGLMAGCATVLRARCPEAEIVAVEPAAGDDFARSLAAGERVSVPPPDTIADGLRVVTPGAWTWTVLKSAVDRATVVTDDELMVAMRWALSNLRLVLEPSGAASLAVALREGRGRCGVLLSGGNVEPAVLRAVVGG